MCPTCGHVTHASATKSEGGKPAGLWQPLQIPQEPWIRVSMDLITQLTRTPRGKGVILVVEDRLAEMTRFIPIVTSVGAK